MIVEDGVYRQDDVSSEPFSIRNGVVTIHVVRGRYVKGIKTPQLAARIGRQFGVEVPLKTFEFAMHVHRTRMHRRLSLTRIDVAVRWKAWLFKAVWLILAAAVGWLFGRLG